MFATLIKDHLPNFKGHAAFYELSAPLEGHTKVVVSAADVAFSGPETYIFPATDEGAVADWLELEGSYRGGLSHEAALNNAGYKLVEQTA